MPVICGARAPSLGRNRHQIARSNCRLIGALIGHPHRSVWVPIPADIIQTDSHFELVTQHHSGGVAALLGRFLLRLGPHKQSRGPFYDKGDPPCGSFTSGGFVHCSSTHSFNLTEIKGASLASRTVVSARWFFCICSVSTRGQRLRPSKETQGYPGSPFRFSCEPTNPFPFGIARTMIFVDLSGLSIALLFEHRASIGHKACADTCQPSFPTSLPPKH